MTAHFTVPSSPLLEVRDLVKTYGGGRRFGSASREVRAIDHVSFGVAPGEILGLVGESGSGKSTTGRMVLRLEDVTSGEIFFDGNPLTHLNHVDMRRYRRDMQVVFQDPYAALNPRMRVGDFVAEPLMIHHLVSSRAEARDRVEALFEQVGLDPRYARRYPHEFSGGQRQRINIARAIGVRPRLIVADEPITALDVSIQAQIINLFKDLQSDLGLAYLFIAHDLSMVRFLCHRVAVMLRGRIVEIGPTEALFANPQHPYTQALISAIPVPDPKIERTRQRIAFDFDQNPHPEAWEMSHVSPGHYVMRGVGL